MSKPRTEKSASKPKESITYYYKAEKRDNLTKEVTDMQYVIGSGGVMIKCFIKKGDKNEKTVIRSKPDGKYTLKIYKNGALEKETEHTVDEIKKYIEKNKNFAFFDQLKSLTIPRKGGKKKGSSKKAVKKASKKKSKSKGKAVKGGSKKKAVVKGGKKKSKSKSKVKKSKSKSKVKKSKSKGKRKSKK